MIQSIPNQLLIMVIMGTCGMWNRVIWSIMYRGILLAQIQSNAAKQMCNGPKHIVKPTQELLKANKCFLTL